MKCQLKPTEPRIIPFDLTMTATIEEFTALRDQICSEPYFYKLSKAISDMLIKVNKTYRGEE